MGNNYEEVKQAAQAWEDTKDLMEEGLSCIIEAKETVAECVQKVGVWWEESDLSKKLNETAENLCAAWKNSPIGKGVAAISTQVNKAAQAIKEKWDNSAVGQFCQKAANSVSEFYEKHKTAINIAIGVLVIAACVAAVVVTGGMATCGICTAMAQGALNGAIIGAVTGTAGGALNSAIDYMEENGTLDGSGRQILDGAAQGFAAGSISGAIDGTFSGISKFKKHPEKFCFVAGTLILTTLGLANIENIHPGDHVYAKDTETGEQDYMPVLETFENEVYTTYTVTIDGESIETTYGHPFYVVDEGWVDSDKLEAGDEVELSDGESGTVDSVERHDHVEPVTVYNFCVLDYHTYYVGKDSVLVHNESCKDVIDSNSGKKANYEGRVKKGNNQAPDNFSPEGAGRSGSFREAKRASGIPNSEQPVSVNPARDKTGNMIPGRDYTFENGKVINEHWGHTYPDDPMQNRGNHFNDIFGNHYDY